MTSAAFTYRLRLLNAAAPILSGDEFKLLDKLNRLTGSCGCRPGSQRLQRELGWKERKLEYQIGGLTGAPSACKSRSRIASRPAIMVCERQRYTDPVHKRVTWRRSFRIQWNVLAQLAGLSAKSEDQGGGLSAKSCGVSSSALEKALPFLSAETHTARAREADPDGGGTLEEPGVCVFSETEGREPEPQPQRPEPKPARQEGDAGRRQENGPPGSVKEVKEVKEFTPPLRSGGGSDADARFTILAAAYGPQEGHLGKARGVFATVVDEYETILRHVNHSSRRREKQQPHNRLWLWRYLIDAPWRLEPVPMPKPPPEPEPELCGPPLPEHIRRARSNAAREACMAALCRRTDVPLRKRDPLESVLAAQSPDLDPPPKIDPPPPAPPPEHEPPPPEPPPPIVAEDETPAYWQRKAAEVRARAPADTAALSEVAHQLANSGAGKIVPSAYQQREMPKVYSQSGSAPEVSTSIEDKIRFVAGQGLEGDALLDIVAKADPEKRSRAELAELVVRVLGEEVST